VAVIVGGMFNAALAADQAIVSKRTIYPGQTISLHDLKAVELYRVPLIKYRFVENFNEIVGMVAAKTILPGHFIPVTAAKTAKLIKAGKKMRITLTSGGLNIVVTAVALSDAGAGEIVRFRNPSSGKVISGLVREDGSVVVQSL